MGARPSEAIEDYAKAIYSLCRQGDGTAGTNALAERLGVTPASVSAMVKKLDERGLVRHVRYNDSPVGRISRQTDYSDYRDVAGVKMPFKWTDTWLDGRDIVEITDVQPNVNIDAAKFAKPAAPVAKAN